MTMHEHEPANPHDSAAARLLAQLAADPAPSVDHLVDHHVAAMLRAGAGCAAARSGGTEIATAAMPTRAPRRALRIARALLAACSVSGLALAAEDAVPQLPAAIRPAVRTLARPAHAMLHLDTRPKRGDRPHTQPTPHRIHELRHQSASAPALTRADDEELAQRSDGSERDRSGDRTAHGISDEGDHGDGTAHSGRGTADGPATDSTEGTGGGDHATMPTEPTARTTPAPAPVAAPYIARPDIPGPATLPGTTGQTAPRAIRQAIAGRRSRVAGHTSTTAITGRTTTVPRPVLTSAALEPIDHRPPGLLEPVSETVVRVRRPREAAR